MKQVVKITLVLTIVCVVCSLLLAIMYGATQKKIIQNQKQLIQQAIQRLQPDAQNIQQLQTKEDITVFILKNKKSKLLGYAFIAAGQGYQGKISILSVIDPKLAKLSGIEIVESVETPGLGSKIQDADFRNQFHNLSVSPEITYTKSTPESDHQIQAITGATISSKAVVNILNTYIAKLKTVIAASKK